MDRFSVPPGIGFLACLLSAGLAVLPFGAAAQAPPPMPVNPERNLNDLAQMKYCQKVLNHPENQSRVYEYDSRRCAAALEQAERNMAWMPEDVQPKMAERADQKARAIMANTRDVTQVLGACRQACQKLTPDYDEAAPTDGSGATKDDSTEPGADS